MDPTLTYVLLQMRAAVANAGDCPDETLLDIARNAAVEAGILAIADDFTVTMEETPEAKTVKLVYRPPIDLSKIQITITANLDKDPS